MLDAASSSKKRKACPGYLHAYLGGYKGIFSATWAQLVCWIWAGHCVFWGCTSVVWGSVRKIGFKCRLWHSWERGSILRSQGVCKRDGMPRRLNKPMENNVRYLQGSSKSLRETFSSFKTVIARKLRKPALCKKLLANCGSKYEFHGWNRC